MKHLILIAIIFITLSCKSQDQFTIYLSNFRDIELPKTIDRRYPSTQFYQNNTYKEINQPFVKKFICKDPVTCDTNASQYRYDYGIRFAPGDYQAVVINKIKFACSTQVKINCIIFIDGKIPLPGYISESYFDVDSIKCDFTYNVGDIYIDSISYYYLNNLEADTEIRMNFTNLNYKKEFTPETFNYTGIIEKEWLFYEYLVINITNINKRKKEYNFDFYTPAEDKKHIKGEFKPL